MITKVNTLKMQHPIYSKIVKLKPNIDKKYAMYLSNLIHKYAKKYNQNPFISVAIAMQESGIRNISRSQSVVLLNNPIKIVKGYSDICLFQIHVNTAVNYNIDILKLSKSLDYCVEQHFRIMRHKRKICKHLAKDSWSCYHSMTRSNRLYYKKLVERYL